MTEIQIFFFSTAYIVLGILSVMTIRLFGYFNPLHEHHKRCPGARVIGKYIYENDKNRFEADHGYIVWKHPQPIWMWARLGLLWPILLIIEVIFFFGLVVFTVISYIIVYFPDVFGFLFKEV